MYPPDLSPDNLGEQIQKNQKEKSSLNVSRILSQKQRISQTLQIQKLLLLKTPKKKDQKW